MGSPLLHGKSDLSHGRCLRALRVAAQRALLSGGFVSRISTDVEPDQMACTSETETRSWRQRDKETQSRRGTGDKGQTQGPH